MSSTTFFKESANEWDNGRPVGISPTGIVFFRLPKAPDQLTEIPFSEIERVEFVPESRGWRIIWSTGQIILCVFLGTISAGVFGSLLAGQARGGLGLWIFSLSWPLLYIGAAMGIFQWFSRLGYYLKVRSRQHRGQFYLEPQKWTELRSTLQDCLAQGGVSCDFPDDF